MGPSPDCAGIKWMLCEGGNEMFQIVEHALPMMKTPTKWFKNVFFLISQLCDEMKNEKTSVEAFLYTMKMHKAMISEIEGDYEDFLWKLEATH